MRPEPANLLILMSDEHAPDVAGWRGHPVVRTPNLDRLAARGTVFTQAQCTSPICVPARAALATGRPVHEIGCWDNVDAWDGRSRSWHHLLRDAGHEVTSIGKLHFRGHPEDDYGFTETLLPMHIHEGRGEPRMLLREPPWCLGDGANMLASAKAGESDYNRYDEAICETAERWLAAKAGEPGGERPWALMVSLVAPHFPLTVPARWFDRFASMPLELPKDYRFGIDASAHPFLRDYAEVTGYNRHFRDEADVRRALAGYYGLVEFLDDKVGRLLRALEAAGLDRGTRVLYLSDHGDNLGARGLWGKSTMFRESVGIPMILSGPGVAEGGTVDTPVDHLDVFPTVLDAVGAPRPTGADAIAGASLLGPLDPDRVVFAEYHTVGARSAVYMLRDRRWKYVHYVGLPPQLFDLEADPGERVDLGRDPAHLEVVAAWEARLRTRLDPEAVDVRAKARQAELVERFGGEAVVRAGRSIGGYTPAPQD